MLLCESQQISSHSSGMFMQHELMRRSVPLSILINPSLKGILQQNLCTFRDFVRSLLLEYFSE